MEITLTRCSKTLTTIIGTLLVDDIYECATLENLALSIPTGSYTVSVYFSPHAGHLLPLLENVSDREMIEIHCGNKYSDSKGCILVGLEHNTDMIWNSRLAFNHLFPQIQKAFNNKEPITIVIQEQYTV